MCERAWSQLRLGKPDFLLSLFMATYIVSCLHREDPAKLRRASSIAKPSKYFHETSFSSGFKPSRSCSSARALRICCSRSNARAHKVIHVERLSEFFWIHVELHRRLKNNRIEYKIYHEVHWLECKVVNIGWWTPIWHWFNHPAERPTSIHPHRVKNPWIWGTDDIIRC